MTREGAINKLNWALDNNTIEDVQSAYDYIIALKMAIKALEQEPKTGKWISTETKGNRYAFWCRYKCSLCGGLSDSTNFCPNCGAKMESKENENIN